MVIFPFALSLIFSLSLGLLPPQPPPPVPSPIAAGTTSALPNSSRRHQCPPPQSAPQPFYAPLTLSPPPASSSSSSPSPLALDRAAVSRPGRHERSDAGSNRLRWVLAAALTRVPTPWTRCPLHHLSVCVCSIWSWSSILCYTLVSGAAPTLALLRPWRPSRQEAKHVIREQNTMVANEIIELFYELIVTRFPIIAKQKECRADLKEGICSLIFAAPRCSEFPELSWMRDLLEKKYGKDFVAAAFICAQMLVSIPCKAN